MALSDMIGLGVTIALTDAFTRGAEGVIAKFREMATEATGSTAAVEAGIARLELGAGALAAGLAISAPLIQLGEHAVEGTGQGEGLRRSVAAAAGDSGGLAGRPRGDGAAA